MASEIRVELLSEADIPSLVSIITPAFANIPSEAILTGYPSDPNSLQAAAERHLHTFRQHARDFAIPCGIKCVHTDTTTGKETIIGGAYWFIYDRPRTKEEYETINYLLSADWVTDPADQAKVRAWLQPVADGRVKWMADKPHGVLMYMAISPEWRRKGAATMVVRWGLDQCQKLGIPAYLEASEEGAPVYEQLGFETMDTVRINSHGMVAEFPIMIRWPEGTRQEEKAPALPDGGK